MLGTAFTGLYNPGYSLGAMVLMAVSPLGFILPAALSKLYDEKELGEVRRYLRHSMKYFLLLALPGAAGLAVLSRPLLAILTTPEIAAEGWAVTPLVAGAMVLWGCALIASQVMVLVKKTAVSGAVMVAAALLNLSLNVLLVPLLGIPGAALSTLLAYGVSFAAMVHLSRGYIKYGVDALSVAKGLAASCLMAGLLAYASPSGLLPTALLAAGGLGLYLCLLVLFRTFSPAEYAFFRSLAGLKAKAPQVASK